MEGSSKTGQAQLVLTLGWLRSSKSYSLTLVSHLTELEGFSKTGQTSTRTKSWMAVKQQQSVSDLGESS